jgi:WhiB family redox-sensing transcriptional regulator
MFVKQVAVHRSGTETNRGETWFTRAACRTADRRLFFEPEGESPKRRDKRIRAAKAVCAGCPVRRECLSFALSIPERYGIWGGFTSRERAVLKRRGTPGPSRRADRRGP